ncbi:Hypothetical_protein [Hexamita inflata]|uniref:Hypothetical_protein n=1 Tax=Hexamita inflata TaxID=28002 RepID=A0AA86V1F1_9EUKA|nr:Hypothetical protein HINF_LOCUS64469 [Hexamita inflata]
MYVYINELGQTSNSDFIRYGVLENQPVLFMSGYIDTGVFKNSQNKILADNRIRKLVKLRRIPEVGETYLQCQFLQYYYCMNIFFYISLRLKKRTLEASTEQLSLGSECFGQNLTGQFEGIFSWQIQWDNLKEQFDLAFCGPGDSRLDLTPYIQSSTKLDNKLLCTICNTISIIYMMLKQLINKC